MPKKILLIVILAVVAGIVGYYVLNAPDRRTPGEKIGNAIDTLPQGPEKAARELKNRTPGEKLEDAAKDTGKDIKKATTPPPQQ